ncbi:MAG: asparagine synthase, partial [Bacteroidales bacterium]|nr:asparagine synthase [Bacteroidales bacterium]
STSMYAQWEVMKVAGGNGMKVLLDGQGADEVLGGYDNFAGAWLLQLLMQAKAGAFLQESARLRVNRQLNTLPALLSAAFHRLPGWMKQSVRRKARLGAGFLSTEFRRAYRHEVLPDYLGKGLREMAVLSLKFGLHDLLRYEDRNSMAFSIESRVPFLDHPLVELGLALPTSLKLRDGYSKYALRHAVQDRLPREVTWRTDKKGFITPQSRWQNETRQRLMDFLISLSWPHQLSKESVMAAAAADLRQGTPSNELWKMVSLLMWKEEFNVRF